MYCTARCQSLHYQREKKAAEPDRESILKARVCGACGKPIDPTRKLGVQFCDRACYVLSWRKRQGFRTCIVCEEAFLPTRTRTEMCVPKHRFMECVERLKARFRCEAV